MIRVKQHDMKGVILDKDSFDRGDIDLTPLYDINMQWTAYNSTETHQILERISDADIVITNKVRLQKASIVQSKNLQLILVAATGTDNVDIHACKQRNIVVCNARQYSTPAVAQHVFALILNLMTNMIQYHRLVVAGKWQESKVFCLLDYPISELSGKTLGIVGYGVLGREVAKIAKAFGMTVMLCQRPGGNLTQDRLPLELLLPEIDILSLHCPLTAETRNLISTEQFNLMKRSAILINSARGAIVDSNALIHALKTHQIAGAGIDVLDIEPPPENHMLTGRSLPNLIVTPHNAWASRESRQRLVAQLANNLQAWKQNQPVNVVHP